MPSKKNSAGSEPAAKRGRVDLIPGRAAVQDIDGTVRLPGRLTVVSKFPKFPKFPRFPR
ncbi:hypothetical protein ACFWPV_27705 [Streptomyces uncialis]|uniref:hypothetical protein n=1 Tax=Streptomyces uncialis TaxID=1048205 RepID=UPI003652BB9E